MSKELKKSHESYFRRYRQVEKYGWEESEKRREEEKVRRQKMQVREKLAKSQKQYVCSNIFGPGWS